MKRRLFELAGVAAFAAFVVACAQSDADITAAIQSKITTDRSISTASHIDVAVNKKVVTLSGTAESTVAKERAESLARSTEEVKRVIDQLAVLPAQAEIAPNTTASSIAGQTPDDATITSSIKSKLAQDRRVTGAKIDVDTRLGIVTLSGTVESEQIEKDALQIAQDTAGVQRVENRLVVEGA